MLEGLIDQQGGQEGERQLLYYSVRRTIGSSPDVSDFKSTVLLSS
jgi:hypothetical protein